MDNRSAVIVGIGQTEFSKNSGRSELQLACEAIRAALDDCGLTPADVDGMTTFTMDTSDEIEVARAVGVKDLVIVETENSVLVCHRDSAERVRDLVQEMDNRRDAPDS